MPVKSVVIYWVDYVPGIFHAASHSALVENLRESCSLVAPWKKSYDKPRKYIKKQRHHFADKGQQSHSQSHGFSSSHVWMWELEEG